MSLPVALSPSQAWCELLARIDEMYVHEGIVVTHSAPV
jgi:hypothetical protein